MQALVVCAQCGHKDTMWSIGENGWPDPCPRCHTDPAPRAPPPRWCGDDDEPPPTAVVTRSVALIAETALDLAEQYALRVGTTQIDYDGRMADETRKDLARLIELRAALANARR